jgi:imidazolonepropionase-like amidohydrolase
LELAIGPLRVDLTSPAEARRRVTKLARAGAQCIKVGYQSEDYSQRRAPLPTIGPGLMRAVAEQARRHGLGVALHAVYVDDLLAVVDLPFDSLEHTPIDGLVDDDVVARLARRHLPVTSTLSAYAPADQTEELARLLVDEPWRFEAKPRATVRRIADGLRRGESISPLFGEWMVEAGATFMRQNVRRLHEAGLPVVFGSDSGTGPGLPGNPIWEMRQLRRAGFSNREALMTATINAAKALGRPDLGRLAIGSTADVILLRANPLEDLEALAEVAAVVRDGRLLFTSLGADRVLPRRRRWGSPAPRVAREPTTTAPAE